MKVISFSLFGSKPMYRIGLIENLKLAKIIYPEFICICHLSNQIDNDYINQLKKYDNCIIQIHEECGWHGMFWRFTDIDKVGVELALSRDADSRLSLRERYVYDEWIKTDKSLLTIRDHPNHNIPILGGMWGMKKPLNIENFSMEEKIKNFNKKYNNWQIDQDFLTKEIWPLFNKNVFDVDTNKGYNIPIHDEEYIGKAYDENGKSRY